MEPELLADPPIDPLSSLTIFAENTSSSGGIFSLPNWACWLLIVLMVIVCGLLSGSENAFDNCNKYHFKVLADKGKVSAKLITRFIDKFDNTLTTVLVANNAIQTLMSFLGAMVFYGMFKGENAETIEAIVATIVMAVIIYVFADTIPKILSDRIPNVMVYVLVWPDFIISIIIWPVAILFRLMLKGVQKLFHFKDESILTKEDFIEKADEALSTENFNNEEEELFEENEIALIDRTFNFDTIPASEVYTPLSKMVSIDVKDLNTSYVNSFILLNEYSRFPVYENKKSNIVGVLSINNYFKEYGLDPHVDVRSVLLPPVFVYDDEKIDDVFETMNKEQIHLAIVKNREEKVIGMITLEDVLDVLVDKNNPAQVGENAI